MPNVKQTPEKIQLDQDVQDVFVLGVKKASDFPEPYRKKLIDTYRFSATRYNSDEIVNVSTSPDTLDIM